MCDFCSDVGRNLQSNEELKLSDVTDLMRNTDRASSSLLLTTLQLKA